MSYCVDFWSACGHVHIKQVPTNSESLCAPGARSVGGCKPPNLGSWDMNLDPSEK